MKKSSELKVERREQQSRSLRFPFAVAKPRQDLLRWYLKKRRDLPWRRLWREHGDPYHIWVSEIMLQQTVIKAVLPVYDRFLAEFPTLHDLASASEEDVRRAVRGLGYYRRFRMLHAASKQLCAERGCGKKLSVSWPKDFAAWKELPGIGDYTAAAISSIAFSYPAAVVDGNVERVFCRLLDLREPPNSPDLKKAFKNLAGEFLDVSQPGDFNQALMELGQTICTPTSPACAICPLSGSCLAEARESQALAPAAKVKAAFEDVKMRLTIFKARPTAKVRNAPARYALLERPQSAKFLKATPGFWTEIERTGTFNSDGLPLNLGNELNADLGSPVGKIKHNITRHKISATVRVVEIKVNELDSLTREFPIEWVEESQVEEKLLANLDRKAWKLIRSVQQSRPLF